MKAFGNKSFYYKRFDNALREKFMIHFSMMYGMRLLDIMLEVVVTLFISVNLIFCIHQRFTISPVMIGIIL